MENIHINFEYQKLEFNKILDKLSGYTYSKYGHEKILNLSPSVKKEDILYSFTLIDELRRFVEHEEKLHINSVFNISEYVKLTEKKVVLNGVNLYEVAYSLRLYFYLKKRFSGDKNVKYPKLEAFLTVLKVRDDFYLDILQYISKDGYIDSKASRELLSVREKIEGIEERIKKTAKEFYNEQKSLGYLSDDIMSVRDGLACVALKANYKARVEGVVVDYSQTGQTVYVVPNRVLELHNQLIMARNEEIEEIKRILKNYSEKVALNSHEIFVIDREILEFDIIYAKTRYSIDNKLNIPKVTDERYIKIVEGKHPLIGEKAVPLNLVIGEDYKMLIITGPNTGGKTVVLKTLGLFALMVQCGIPIPAGEDSVFCIFNRIFVDIGDEQSIENSLSTFSAHIKKLTYILNYSTKNSLILIDELCAGTDPIEGSALAIAILKYIKNIGPLSIITTHYSDLKNFASKEETIENGSMEFDNNTLAPTYRLLIGVPGSSKALEISKRLGINEEILEEAKRNINPAFLDSEKLLLQLEQKNLTLDEMEKKLINKENNLKEKESEIINKRELLKEKEKELDKLLKLRENEFLKESRRRFEELIKDIKTSNASKEKIIDGKIFFEDIKKHIEEDDDIITNDDVYKKGDCVLILSSNSEGYIIDVSNNPNEYIVQAGIIKLNIKSNDLKRIESKRIQKSENAQYRPFIPETKSLSLDLRGLRYDEAEKKLDEFISNSLASNTKVIKIIHGKGSGALRKCIQDYFDNSPFVVDYDFEKDKDSGINYGVTVAKLR